MSYKEHLNKLIEEGKVLPTDYLTSSDVIRDMSSLMHEFKESSFSLIYDDDINGGKYTKTISPLFYDKVIDEENNLEFLDIITSFIPYYYLEPNIDVVNPDDISLKETRDLGINDVPSPLQNNSFYSTWFRDAWGFVQNNLILDLFNKLRYPFINENQYLNSFLFPKLADEIFNESTSITSDSYIGFMNTEEENDSVYDKENYPYYGEEIGCLDYVDDIVNKKINASYSLIDYTNKQNIVLNKWGESLFESGQLNREDLDTSKTIFKLQDIKNELLRRKFSGSRTLYDLAISTVNRQGSFVTAIRYYDLPDETQKKDDTYHNKRLIRVLRLPGLISKPFDFDDKFGVNLFKAYLDTNFMPINTLLPLFFSSAPFRKTVSEKDPIYFDSEQFFSGFTSSPEEIENYKGLDTIKPGLDLLTFQNYFLRDNSNVIDWGSLDGIIMTDNVNQRFKYLDDILSYDEEGNPVYRTLDSLYDKEYDAKKAAEYAENIYRRYSQAMRLDIKETVLDLNLVSAAVADVNADKVLYHRNSLQDILGENYPYVTYPIAKNNGLSLIDTYWLDYVEKEIRNKSKVQDNTEIGTQINTMLPISSSLENDFLTGEHYFFGVSFAHIDSKSDFEGSFSNIEIRDYEENDNCVLLWYCTVEYSLNNNKIISFNKKLISKIFLREDASNISGKFKKDDIILDEYKKYTEYNIGVLPFTYNSAVDNVIWNNNIGFFKEEDGDAEKSYFIDDIDSLEFSEAYFVFSNNNLLKNCVDIGKNPNFDTLDPLIYCSLTPSTETKTIFYVVKKSEFTEGILTSNSDGTSSEESHKSGTVIYDENGNMTIREGVVEDKYYWSEPISVIHLSGEFISKLEGSDFYPEWYNLGYFFNAYLNFNKDSASPIRNKFVIPSIKFKNLPEETDEEKRLKVELAGGEENIYRDEQNKIKYIKNPGENAALSNLSRIRGLDFVCNDDGGDFNEGGQIIEPSEPTIWLVDIDELPDTHPARKYEGMFLKRNRPKVGKVSLDGSNFEYSSIYGDNRYLDAFDSLYEGIFTFDRDKYEDVSKLESPPSSSMYNYLFAVIFIGKDSYEYFVWDRTTEPAHYRSVDISSSENRSKLRFDDNNMNCLEIIPNKGEEGQNNRRNGSWFENYFTISTQNNEKFKWYWDEFENGKTICFNIGLNEDSKKILNNSVIRRTDDNTEVEEVLTDQKEILLFNDSNFRLSIFSRYKNGENIESAKVNFSIKYINSDDEESCESTFIKIPEIDINNNYRISASYLNRDSNPAIFLVVNNESDSLSNPNIPQTLRPAGIIELFSEYVEETESKPWSQENCFYGYIYDMRFYTCGKTEEELRMLNFGSLRELYSYSPASYKLANTIYRDTAVLKKVFLEDPYKLPRIDSFRIFNRSVWDSILVDNCPVTKYEKDISSPQYREDFANPVGDSDIYKVIKNDNVKKYFLNDCVEQDLLKDIEVFNGLSTNISNGENLRIEYHSSSKPTTKEINNNFLMTLVTALVEPGDYDGDYLNSLNLKFKLETDEDGYKYVKQEDVLLGAEYISIPVQSDSSDDYFSYSADIDYNFKLFSDFDISKWLSRGSNVQLEYNSLLDKSIARLADISLRDSESNNVLLPFIVPTKDELSNNPLYLDRFYAKDVVLNNSLSTFLNASSYYSEIQIPVSIIKGEISYEQLEDNFKVYELSTTTYPEKNVTYYTFLNGEVESIFRFPNKPEDPPTGDPKFFTKRTAYGESFFYTPRLDVYTKVSASNEKGFNYVNIITGEIWNETSDPVHILKGELKDDGSYVYKELDIDVNYFEEGYVYKYSDQDDSFLNLLNLGNNSLYIKESNSYSLCVSPYNVSREYYLGWDIYEPFTEDSFEVATVYYIRESNDFDESSESDESNGSYRPTTTEDFDGVGNTVFDKDKLYYTDFLTNSQYYCLKDGVYVFTNEAYPSISTFNEWYDSTEVSNKKLFLRKSVGTPTYYNKWDALRVLKEGTYYFTCKYPMQILPFTDDKFDSSINSNYTTYYASCRLKVVVKGTPTILNSDIEEKVKISGYPKKYWAENLESTLKSSSQRYLDDDNRTFPHRTIDIDLYAMDITNVAGITNLEGQEAYHYQWVKIASNHKSNEEINVLSLDKTTVENQIVLTSNIPFFLEKNYVSPFFISRYERGNTEESAASADDDIIYPIEVIDKSLSSDENIESNSEDDMDNQKIISGKSYKVLFEYTGSVTEISYIDKIYEDEEFAEGSAEKINYSRLVNLLDTTTLNTSEYMYNTDGRSFINNYNLNYYTSGYKTIKEVEAENAIWSSVSEEPQDNNFYFGCPYSRSSERNYLLKIRNTSLDSSSSINRIDTRQNINNSYTFPYVVENNDSDTNIPAYIVPSLGIGAVVDDTGAFKRIPFDELNVVKSHFKELEGIVLNSISSLKTQACGLFLGLSTFTPNFVENNIIGNDYSSDFNPSYLKFESINNKDFGLYGYFASSRFLKVKNNSVFLERRNLYSNNLLSNNSFENRSDWVITGAKLTKYVSDNSWGDSSGLSDNSGKDVFEIEPSGSSVSIKYSTGDLSIKAKYEAAICIKPINDESTNDIPMPTIDIVYYSGNVEVYRGNLDTRVDMDNGWYNYSAETSDVIVADSIEFIINCSSTFRITKAVIRKCNIVSQYLGLSNVLNQVTSNTVDSKIAITSHNMVVYQNKESGEFFPVQFNNETISSVTLGGRIVKRPKSGLSKASEFISSYNLGSYGDDSRLVSLYSPWIRRFYYYSDNKGVACRTNKYQIKTNLLGKREIVEIKSNVSDIIDTNNVDISNTLNTRTSKHNLFINKMSLSLDKNNCLETFGMNLAVDENDPIIISNEKFTSLFNCLDPEQYREGKDYSVAVTNIQLLSTDGELEESYKRNKVVYELEYLPIIYSERKNHLSLNILLYKG